MNFIHQFFKFCCDDHLPLVISLIESYALYAVKRQEWRGDEHEDFPPHRLNFRAIRAKGPPLRFPHGVRRGMIGLWLKASNS